MSKKQAHSNLLFDHREICEAIFNHSAEAILLIDEDSTIVHANPTALNLFKYQFDELIDRPINALIPKKYHGIHGSHVKRYNDDPMPRNMAEGMELHGLRKDHSTFPLNISLSPTQIQGKRIIAALVIDISEQVDAKNKLKKLNQELEQKVDLRTRELATMVNRLENANKDLRKAEEEVRQALEAEKQLNELKSRFVSMASHEFRTPLSTILTSVSLIEKYGIDENFNEKRNKHYQRIKSNVRNLTSILNDFLSLDKLQEGRVETLITSFDLDETAREIIEDLDQQLKKGQTIVYTFTGDHYVLSDKNLVKNIIINLMSNAIKYSQENKQIEFTIKASDKIIIAIKDHGIGIPKEEQVHLFGRFFRAKNATAIQGTGLGLTIVKRYADLLNGNIEFESEYMVGSRFVVTLPNTQS